MILRIGDADENRLHRAFGMDPQDIIALAEQGKKDVRSKRHRLYSNLYAVPDLFTPLPISETLFSSHIIRARKPTACEVLASTVRPGSSSSVQTAA